MDAVQTAQSNSTGPQPTPDPASDDRLLTSDFQTFLTMLTTQMQNQDPLNPIESTDFATQLATFSGVEQQIRTNDLLTSLQSSQDLMNMGQLSGWVGMEARAEMPATFTGTPINLVITPDDRADRMALVVRDANGAEIQRLTFAPGDDTITWAGVDADGNPMPQGIYSFTAEAYADDILIEEQPVQVYADVEEALIRDGETWLIMAGGVNIRADQVQGIRNP
ncbi:flagellar basal body rod modification protein [Rhodophyticola sp. CCM32]|uniref:flagellar hook capping FlgD N-terminal domain-containing protein n=1 Tax=Rhodophyticola sp. CCM32 TaxID=2916397 RepID=UPI00107F6AA2|nr:flagellar hook capping FlgD N-terminal domain-containing protein [Rhodophyticola sp. CCM32]QBY01917.1 flagellar basal body rod modification protein [Rhodophyticola sp. CCM32]